jgi:hypothetical protein
MTVPFVGGTNWDGWWVAPIGMVGGWHQLGWLVGGTNWDGWWVAPLGRLGRRWEIGTVPIGTDGALVALDVALLVNHRYTVPPTDGVSFAE